MACVDFSVLISVYANDDPVLFSRALDSIFSNSLPPAEVVLVVDGPISAALWSVVETFARSEDSLVVHELLENVGLAEALNSGLDRVSYEFVARADADDENLPDRFCKQMLLMARGFDLVGGAIIEHDEFGNPIASRIPPCSEDEIRRFSTKRNPFNHMTVSFRKSLVLECGGYPDIFLKEDYALWAVMLSKGARVSNTSDVLVNVSGGRDMYRRRGGLHYAISELELQRLLYSLGLKGFFAAFLDTVARSTVFLLPSSIRGFVYERFLRSRK